MDTDFQSPTLDITQGRLSDMNPVSKLALDYLTTLASGPNPRADFGVEFRRVFH